MVFWLPETYPISIFHVFGLKLSMFDLYNQAGIFGILLGSQFSMLLIEKMQRDAIWRNTMSYERTPCASNISINRRVWKLCILFLGFTQCFVYGLTSDILTEQKIVFVLACMLSTL